MDTLDTVLCRSSQSRPVRTTTETVFNKLTGGDNTPPQWLLRYFIVRLASRILRDLVIQPLQILEAVREGDEEESSEATILYYGKMSPKHRAFVSRYLREFIKEQNQVLEPNLETLGERIKAEGLDALFSRRCTTSILRQKSSLGLTFARSKLNMSWSKTLLSCFGI